MHLSREYNGWRSQEELLAELLQAMEGVSGVKISTRRFNGRSCGLHFGFIGQDLERKPKALALAYYQFGQIAAKAKLQEAPKPVSDIEGRLMLECKIDDLADLVVAAEPFVAPEKLAAIKANAGAGRGRAGRGGAQGRKD